MSDTNNLKDGNGSVSEETLSLNDDRRVKTLSPGAMVVKRFFRNRLAVLGLVMLAIMFLFSFVGGMVSPYGEDEQFYTYTFLEKEYVGVTRNEDFRYVSAEGADFGSAAQAQFLMAQMMGKPEFDYKDVTYGVEQEGQDFYAISVDGSVIAIAYKDIVNAADNIADLPFSVKYAALQMYTNGSTGAFSADGQEYTLDEDGNIIQGEEAVGYISRFVVQSRENGVVISRDFKERLEEVLDNEGTEFVYTGEDGEEHNYTITYDAAAKVWSVMQETETYVYSQYESPSKTHPLGTDANGMDMLTRLMYGGRVSLIIGFIVVIIETVLGVILGGISGYFGKWVDNLIMRIVDIFYCHGRYACGSPDPYVLSDADPWLPWMAEYCPPCPGTDPFPAGTGIHDGDGSLRNPCFPPDLQASDSQCHSPADRHLYDESRFGNADGGDVVFPGTWC